MLHTPHGLSTERRCSANLHQNVFWLGKREVCNEKFWQPYLCVFSELWDEVLKLGAALWLTGSCPPCVLSLLERVLCAAKFPVARKVPVYLCSSKY